MNRPSRNNLACTLTESGEEKLLRVATASDFLAELLSTCAGAGFKNIPAEGAAAVFACLAEQLDDVVRGSSSVMGNKNVN